MNDSAPNDVGRIKGTVYPFPHSKVNTENLGFSDNRSMDIPTRPELEARLELIEARMDARMAHIDGLVSSIAKSQDEVATSHKSTRNTIIGTGIAVVLGIAAFNATVLSNMVASFESGKNTASAQAASEKTLIKATRALEAATEKAKEEASSSAVPTLPTQPQQ